MVSVQEIEQVHVRNSCIQTMLDEELIIVLSYYKHFRRWWPGFDTTEISQRALWLRLISVAQKVLCPNHLMGHKADNKSPMCSDGRTEHFIWQQQHFLVLFLYCTDLLLMSWRSFNLLLTPRVAVSCNLAVNILIGGWGNS